MKRIIVILLSISMLQTVLGQGTADHRLPSTHIQLEGYVNERLLNSIDNRILAQDVDRLIEVFNPAKRTETHMWQSEFWGKWFTSAVLAYKYHPSDELYKTLEKAVYGLLKYQTADGYIGNYADKHRLEQWDIWGRKYCMLGLLSFYDLKQDKKVLQAAEQLANGFIHDLNKADGIIVTKGNYRGMAASSILEPFCQLYIKTKNKKYLDFAETIVKQWSLAEGPRLIEKSAEDVAKRFEKPSGWYSWEQGQKAYEMMSCYEGLLELYRLTGKEEYKIAVEKTWANIDQTEINIAGSGASTEMWFGGKALQADPIHHYQEVCVTVTWIKLSLQLFRLTGEAKYAEAAEMAYYNALLGSLSKDGAQWAKYTPLNGQRLPGSEQCGMGLNCCEASGPRALFLMPFYAVTQDQKQVQVNYYLPGSYDIQVGKQRAKLIIKTDYPVSGEVTIGVQSDRPISIPLQLRIPSWSKGSEIAFNRSKVDEEVSEGQYIDLSRTWKNGEEINLKLNMQGRLMQIGTEPKSFAIMRGPVVLARDAVFNEQVPMGAVLSPVLDKNENLSLTALPAEPGTWMKFKAEFLPESYTEKGPNPVEITLCDYASAGNVKPFTVIQTWFPQLINKSK